MISVFTVPMTSADFFLKGLASSLNMRLRRPRSVSIEVRRSSFCSSNGFAFSWRNFGPDSEHLGSDAIFIRKNESDFLVAAGLN